MGIHVETKNWKQVLGEGATGRRGAKSRREGDSEDPVTVSCHLSLPRVTEVNSESPGQLLLSEQALLPHLLPNTTQEAQPQSRSQVRRDLLPLLTPCTASSTVWASQNCLWKNRAHVPHAAVLGSMRQFRDPARALLFSPAPMLLAHSGPAALLSEPIPLPLHTSFLNVGKSRELLCPFSLWLMRLENTGLELPDQGLTCIKLPWVSC